MIVKDEARGIVQTLESVRPYIDRWTILDTGSTDGTQDLVCKALDGIPGQLHEEPFVDFGTTRSRALELAGTTSVFTLMLSGDEHLVHGDALRSFCEAQAAAPHGAYYVEVHFGDDRYDSARLTTTAAGWRYVGATHEVLVEPGAGGAPSLRVPNAHVFHDISHRDRASANRGWQRDRLLLSAAHQQNPRDTRSTFYLAQTLECLGEHQAARDMYEHRVKQGGWVEEVYEALFRIARCAQALDEPWEKIQQLYLDAHSHSPHRAEPLYRIAKYWWDARNYPLMYLFAQRGATLPYPAQSHLFIEHAIYEWKLHDLVGIAGFYVGEHAIGRAATEKALAHRPDDAHLIDNLRHYDRAAGKETFTIVAEDLDALRRRLGQTKVVVSVTTIPSRERLLRQCLESLSAQRFQPDKILLCLPTFSKREKVPYRVPSWLGDFPLAHVAHCEEDWGPATKLLGALRAVEDPDTILITVDDDVGYDPHLIEKLVRHSLDAPDAAVGFRGWNAEPLMREHNYGFVYEEWNHRYAYPARVNILEGYGGVAYRRRFFDDAVFDYSCAPEAAFYVDDVWISGHLAMKRIPRVVHRYCAVGISDVDVWQKLWRPNGWSREANGVSLAPEFRDRNRGIAMYFALQQSGIWIDDAAPRFASDNLSSHEQTLRDQPRDYIYKALALLGNDEAPATIVELGSMRSPLTHPIDESRPCCGDGHSTYLLGESGHRVFSVDVNPEASHAARTACVEMPNVHVVTGDGIEFLHTFSDSIDLLFLDAWDVVHDTPYAEKHAEAFDAARDKLAARHLVLIDDTDIASGGKGRILIPKLKALGYEQVFDGRQTLYANFPLSQQDKQRILDLTYDGPLYQLGDHSRGSGPGSEPGYTEGYRAFLANFLCENNIRSVLDLGCGNWRSTRLIDWTGIDYLGVDFIHKIVAKNRRLHGAANIKFTQGDVRSFDIPAVDLVISKDVLQHWPTKDVVAFLERLRASSAKMALLVNCANDDGHPRNRDIAIGAFRPIHLNELPFSAQLEEIYAFHSKKVLLWRSPSTS
jgi:SAM-dependent methyltransferase